MRTRHSAWAVLIDLDNDAACAPTLQEKWLALLLPVLLSDAVRAVETWLLADRQRFAQFLSIQYPASRRSWRLWTIRVAAGSLARHSRKRAMRKTWSQGQSSGRGRASICSSLIEFVEDYDTRLASDVAQKNQKV